MLGILVAIGLGMALLFIVLCIFWVIVAALVFKARRSVPGSTQAQKPTRQPLTEDDPQWKTYSQSLRY